MRLFPCALSMANEIVGRWHRHSDPATIHRFAIGLEHDGHVIGACIVGRPKARRLDIEGVAEVVRCCVAPGSPKGACSMLYAAAWRAWQAMGGHRIVTYTWQSESGASLRGAGWVVAAELDPVLGVGWENRSGRKNSDSVRVAKLRWEATRPQIPLLDPAA